MAKKFRKEYQPRDPATGAAIGTPQVFEADTQEELIDKLAAAHENASVTVYKAKRAAKVGALMEMEPDPEVPFRVYEETVLSADDRVAMANALKDPANTPHVIKKILASYGIPVDDVRQMLREKEIEKQRDFMFEQAQLFSNDHPEYVDSEHNNQTMLKYINKHNMAWTKKNLEIAYADLTDEGLLTVRAPEQPVQVAPAVSEPVVAAAPVPEQTITATATPAAPISAEPTDVRPKVSSSGLSRENSSAAPGAPAPKAPGITAQDVARMSSTEYNLKLRDPEFRKAVDQLGR